MRYAIVSDIHANLQAWEAVVADMANFQVDHMICLGDIVGYGPDPSQVIKAVRELASATVVGNHDAAVCGRMDSTLFNDNAREVIEWTTARIRLEDLDYLKRLPAMVRPEGAGFCAVHAEVVDPMAFGYVLDERDAMASFAACDDQIIFIGHTHRAGVFVQHTAGNISIHEPEDYCCVPENRYIINPGSVGDPRSEDIVASYAIYDDVTRDVYFRRLEFDIASYRKSIDDTEIVSRPFFLRYLDSMSGSEMSAIPSVQETDGVPQINLTTPSVEQEKKDPFVRIGVAVLLIAAVAGIWFFTHNQKPSQKDGVTQAKGVSTEKESDAKVSEASKQRKKPVVSDKMPVSARFVRISLPRVGVLCLAEVEVYSEGKNIARQGKAKQSSSFSEFSTADKAIDGNMSGQYGKKHMTHTRESDSNWWLLDLGKAYRIDQIIIWNRDEGGTAAVREKLKARLDGYTLEMFDQNNDPVYLKKNNPGKKVRNLVK